MGSECTRTEREPLAGLLLHTGGTINLTRYLTSHSGTRGVRANAISHGCIDHNPEKLQADEVLERYSRMTMLACTAFASELGEAAVFLFINAPTFITGANLPDDHGDTAK